MWEASKAVVERLINIVYNLWIHREGKKANINYQKFHFKTLKYLLKKLKP